MALITPGEVKRVFGAHTVEVLAGLAKLPAVHTRYPRGHSLPLPWPSRIQANFIGHIQLGPIRRIVAPHLLAECFRVHCR